MTPATRERWRGWIVPALLILLGVMPAAAGVFRLVTLEAGHVSPDNAGFFDRPVFWG